jgi:hypothetical protein
MHSLSFKTAPAAPLAMEEEMNKTHCTLLVSVDHLTENGIGSPKDYKKTGIRH